MTDIEIILKAKLQLLEVLIAELRQELETLKNEMAISDVKEHGTVKWSFISGRVVQLSGDLSKLIQKHTVLYKHLAEEEIKNG